MAADAATSGGAAVTSVGNSALYVSGNSENLTYTEQAGTSTNKQYISFWMYYTGITTAVDWFISCDDGSNTNRFQVYFGSTITVLEVKAGSVQCYLISTRQLRDIGWYHIELLLDTTQAFASERNILKVNNVRLTEFSTETNFTLNDTFGTLGSAGKTFHWGRSGAGGAYLDAYLAESVRIDGDPAGISTGEYDSTGLYWTPKSSTAIKELTFGNNGFYLDNTTNAQTDASGEGNNFTNNNTVTTTDLMSPTKLPRLLWNPLSPLFAATLSEGNTVLKTPSVHKGCWANTNFPKTGKWQTEVLVDINRSGDQVFSFGVMKNLSAESINQYVGTNSQAYGWYHTSTFKFYSATSELFEVGSGRLPEATHKFQICWDASAGDGTADLFFGVDNVWYAADGGTDGNPVTGANPTIVNLDISNSEWSVLGVPYTTTLSLATADEAAWEYTIQTGYTALTLTDIAASVTRTASDTNKYFQTTLYEGNGAGQRVGAFQPFDNSFTIAKSSLFNVLNDEYFSRTFETPTDQDVWTLSWWMKTGNLVAGRGIFASAALNSSFCYINNVKIYIVFSGTTAFSFSLDDSSQWYNIILTCNGGTVTCYVNGVSRGTASASMNDFNSAVAHTIGSYNGNESHFDGYMADFVFVDGAVHSTSVFGQTDTSTNRWIPKDPTITLDEASDFGNNGFYLNFADSSALGDDISGNNHDFTNNNTVTQSTDSPTTNFNTYDPNESSGTFKTGNTISLAGNNSINIGTLPLRSGKWVFEATGTTASLSAHFVGVAGPLMPTGNGGTQGGFSDGYMLQNDANLFIDGSDSGVNASATWTTDDVIRLEIDRDNHTLQWFKNGSSILSITNVYDKNWRTCTSYATFMATTMNSGATAFAGTPTTDFIAISQDNMAGTDQFISAFSWIKNRDATDNHMLFDRVRGVYKDWHSNLGDIQVTNVNTVQSFLEAGVQVGDDVQVNTANESYVLWNWMMEATGSGASNEDGSINTTSTLVDTTLGLSISTYTGTGANATFGHGLGVAPKFIIIKGLTNGELWQGFASGLGPTKTTHLNNVSVSGANSVYWNNTAPTSTLVSLGSTGGLNGSTIPYVAYCFAPSQFISIGSYEGNGNANGAFIPTINSLGVPIQPVWAITKSIDSTSNWDMYDKERLGYNPENAHLDANLTTVESTADNLDIVTGGLKMRIATDPNVAETYVYMAIGTPIIDVDGRIIAGR